MFEQESNGLKAINKAVDGFAPRVLHFSTQALMLEWLSPAAQTDAFWLSLAEQLVAMHQFNGEQFGFVDDNYCGATPQPNPQMNNGFEFFAEHRLIYQTKLAFDAGLLPSSDVSAIETIARNLPQWLPEQPAVLLHGDLWSGNVMSTSKGAKLIDPACYFGFAEADLAMTLLFGGFSSLFYRHYAENSNMAPDWQDRAELYNLYHLLNHLNLFGGQYLSAVHRVLRRYG